MSDALHKTLEEAFKYIENESFSTAFDGLFSEINLNSGKLGKNYSARNDNLRSINIFIPKQKEQQKIAETLTSLDNLIEAKSKKVETLKQHKKGLMQKLFVNKEEN